MLMPKDIEHRKLLMIQPFGPVETALKIETGNLLMVKDDEKVDKMPLYSLLAIFIIGRLTVTTQFLRECAECGVAVFFLTENFDTYARCGAETQGNYLLRQRQYASTRKQDLMLSRNLMTHKIQTQVQTLQHFGKPIFPTTVIDDSVQSRDTLLGIEGNITAKYFATLFDTIGWHRRMPQAKSDEINLLMDMGYTMLFNLIDDLLGLFGFDSYRGIYHQLFFARKSLACDIMEPWRVLVDVAIVLMFRQNMFHKKDFICVNGSFRFAHGFKDRSKYARVFLKVLSSHKLPLFEYVRGYYLHISKPDAYDFRPPLINFEHMSISHSS